MSVRFWSEGSPSRPDIQDCGCGPNPRCSDCKGTGRVNFGPIYEVEFTTSHNDAAWLLQLLWADGASKPFGAIRHQDFTRLRDRISQVRAQRLYVNAIPGDAGGEVAERYIGNIERLMDVAEPLGLDVNWG